MHPLNVNFSTGRNPYSYRHWTHAAIQAALWPLNVWVVRTWTQYTQVPDGSLELVSVASFRAVVDLSIKELNGMKNQGIRGGLYPGVFVGVATSQMDWLIRELVSSLLMNQTHVADAVSQRNLILGALNRRMNQAEQTNPERAALSAVMKSLEPFTPIAQTTRFFIGSLISTVVASTLTYPLRTITYRMIAGQISSPIQGFKEGDLWSGFGYYILGAMFDTVTQQVINYGVNQMYEEVQAAVTQEKDKEPSESRVSFYLVSTVVSRLVLNVLTAPFTGHSIHQRLHLPYNNVPYRNFLWASNALAVGVKDTLEL